MKRFMLTLAVLGTTGCTALDLWDTPVVTLEDRPCNDNTDCETVRFEIPLSLTDPCLVPKRVCDFDTNRCTVDLRVRDTDGDEYRDQACATAFPQFEPFKVDCIDDDRLAFPLADLDDDSYYHRGCGTGSLDDEDCDDTRSTVRPGASEACDGVVSACVGTDEPDIRLGEDDDGDRHSPVGATICEDAPDSYPKDDCDDDDEFVYPGAADVCDGRENDCNISTLPDPAEDADGDGFAPTAATDNACNALLAGSFPTTDCDDANGNTYPDAPEACDRIINDCTARTSSNLVRAVEDPDGDGYYGGDADCTGAVVSIECSGAANDATTRQCPPRLETSLGTNPDPFRQIATDDFDDDGFDDIVARPDGANDPVLIHTTTGLNWLSVGFTGGAAEAVDLVILNMDADARSEVLVRRTNGLAAYEITGSGAALNVAVAGVAVPTSAGGPIAVGDLDADGRQELVYVPDAGAAIRWHEPTAAPTSGDVALTAPVVVSGLALADLDGNTFDDIIVMTDGSSDLTVYMSTAAHVFAAPTTITVGTIGVPSKVVGGDFDGAADGFEELAVLGPALVPGAETTMAIIARQLDGTYLTRAVGLNVLGQPLAVGEIDVADIATRDLDRDGRDELLYASYTADTVAYVDDVVLAGGTHAFAQHPVVTDFESANVVGSGDLDRDGDIDVIGGTGTAPGALAFWRSEFLSNLTFSPHNVDRAFESVVQVAIADVDSDSRPDILARSKPLEQVTLWRSRDEASSSFDERPLLDASSDGPFAFTVTNAAGSSPPDVVVGINYTATGDQIQVLPGRGDGTYEAPVTVASIDNPSDLVGANIDGALRDEIVAVTNGTAAGVVVYQSDIAGATFTQHVIDASVMPCTGVAVGDVDVDGDIDIVAACGAANLRLYVNPGPLVAFTTSWAMVQLALGGSGTYKSLALGDLTGDGYLDVLALSTAANLDIIALSATATVSDRRVVSPGFGAGLLPNAMAIGDLDGDGDLDIVVSDNVSTIRWVQCVQAQRGRYVSQLLATNRPNTTSLAIGDLDSDGIVDVAAVVRTDSDVVWWSTGGVPWWNH